MKPKYLKTKTECTLAYDYKPEDITKLESGPQTITIYPPPFFIMSPRTKLYWAKDIVKYQGYLHKFQPLTIPISEEGPEAILNISIITNEDHK